MPAFNKAHFTLVPVARMQQRLHVEQVAVSDRYDSIQLAASIVVAISQRLHRLGKIFFEPLLKLRIRVLT